MKRGKPATSRERILILGYEKSAKTRLATSLPWGPYWGEQAVYVAIDPGAANLRSVLAPNIAHLEVVQPDIKGPHWCDGFVEVATYDWAKEGFGTLIWDTMTETSKILLKHYSESGVFSSNQSVMIGTRGTPGWHTSHQPGDYGAAQNSIGHIMWHLERLPLNLIVITHKKYIEPKAKHPDGVRGGPDIVGKEATRWLGGFFSSVFHTEVNFDPKTRTTDYLVHTTTKGIWPAGYRTNNPAPALAPTVKLEADPSHFWRDYEKDVRTEGESKNG